MADGSGARDVSESHKGARRDDVIEQLRTRARLARLVGLSTPWGKLPQSAQNALYGLAAELDEARELLEADRG